VFAERGLRNHVQLASNPRCLGNEPANYGLFASSQRPPRLRKEFSQVAHHRKVTTEIGDLGLV